MGIKRTEESHPFKENLTGNAERLARCSNVQLTEVRKSSRGQILLTSAGGWLPSVRLIPPAKVSRT